MEYFFQLERGKLGRGGSKNLFVSGLEYQDMLIGTNYSLRWFNRQHIGTGHICPIPTLPTG